MGSRKMGLVLLLTCNNIASVSTEVNVHVL